MDGANPSFAATKDKRSIARQAPTCDEEARRGRRLGAEKDSTTLVGQMKRSVEDVTKRHGAAQIVSLPVLEGGQKPDPRKDGQEGAKGPRHQRKSGSGTEESRRTL